MENKELRLARALAKAVRGRLDRGLHFVRVPEIASPFPVRAVIDEVCHGERPVRFAVLTVDAGEPAGAVGPAVAVTNSIGTAIDWRNDESVNEPLIILGNLERDRAAGLSEITTVSEDEVRRNLFRQLGEQSAAVDPPAVLLRLFDVLGAQRWLTDLWACADYCETIRPHEGAFVVRARTELWRLGLLPDTKSPDLDSRAIRRNHETVGRLLALDATAVQRLMNHLTELGGGRFEAIKAFSSSGEAQHLQDLEFEAVADALRTVASQSTRGGSGVPSEGSDRSRTIAQMITDSGVDEDDILRQLRELPQSASVDRTLSLGSESTDWAFDNIDLFASYLSSDLAQQPYARACGSTRTVDPDVARDSSPSVEWGDLEVLRTQLQTLETRTTEEAPKCGEQLSEVISLREALEPYIHSLMSEGVRLFVASPKLRGTAKRLVTAWVSLWENLDVLRRALPEQDRQYVGAVAERLSACDLRIVRQGLEVSAQVLPLHPILLEPRVRAAEVLSEAPELGAEMFDLVTGAVDPALPSLSVRYQGSPVSLGYAGTRDGLLHYAREAHHIDASDVPTTIKQVIARFVSVHPYAELSLSVALVKPAARVAKAVMRWLGEGEVQRARLDIFADPDGADDIRAALDEALEEMVSGEVENASVRFGYAVTPFESLDDLPGLVDASEGPPHVLMFFDLADVEQSGVGGTANVPSVGALVAEWEFSTNPLEGSRPVIRPRPGSSELMSLVNAQAGLFGSSVAAQERSPLLSKATEAVLAELSSRATWIGSCEGMAAFVPTPRVGGMDLLGRLSATSHVAFVYSAHAGLLLEPILRYLQKNSWLHPDHDALATFLLDTVRRAVPEGLLGFFRAGGSLSNEAVLGRLGLAAVLGYLEEEEPGRLVVSLDTDGARRWLGLRDGRELRADLLAVTLGGEGCVIEAIEVKSRTEPVKWGQQSAEWLTHAVDQVGEIEALLDRMFLSSPDKGLAPSRREILKRQVFLEALQQWEAARAHDARVYEANVAALNSLFEALRV